MGGKFAAADVDANKSNKEEGLYETVNSCHAAAAAVAAAVAAAAAAAAAAPPRSIYTLGFRV